MNNLTLGHLIQRVVTIMVVIGFFFMPFVFFSVKTTGMDIPTVAIAMSAVDISNGFTIRPVGFPIYFPDWSSPNGVIWLLILPVIYGWFVFDMQGPTRRRELGIGALLSVVGLIILVAIAFSISAVNAKIEDAVLRDGQGLSRVGLGFIFDILSNYKTRLTVELSYGWWFLLVAYVLMGVNLLREMTIEGSQIIQVARGSVANMASGVASALSPNISVVSPNTQPISATSVSSAQTLEQKLERLRKLHESGAISDAEYDATRQQYITEI